MPRKSVGGRAVTEQMGAASAAMLELNDHWIAYLRWRKSEAENRLRATGDLDDILATLNGGADPPPLAPLEGAAGLSPWATSAAGIPTGAREAEDDPANAALPASGEGAPAALWDDWFRAGEPVDELADDPADAGGGSR